MSKPKILFIAPLPPPLAGPEISAKLFLRSQVNDCFRIIPLNTNFRTSNSEKGRVGFEMFIAFFKLHFHVIKNLIRHKPKIVYYYVTATMLGWLGKDIWVILWSKLFGRKIVIHMRAGHFRTNYQRANSITKYIIKRVLNVTDFNLAQSPSLAKQYHGIVKDTSKVGFIYNMIALEKYSQDNYTAYNENIILFLGHLSHAKGYCNVLQAIPKVAKHYPNIKFCFAGTLITKERNVMFNSVNQEPIDFLDPEIVYKTYIQNKYESNYMYLGKLEEKEKKEWLKKCNLFILPSYSEGFSMAVLEGLASGKPIVASPVGAFKDILQNGKNGILITPGDVEAFSNGILTLLKDKTLREEIAANNRILRKKFGVCKVSKKYNELFKNVIKSVVL